MLGEAIAYAEAVGMRGHLAGLHAAHAHTLLECGKTALAAEAAHRALDYLQSHASLIYRPLIWLRCAKVLRGAGELEAARACGSDGRRWIERLAGSLPDEFRSSFLVRNPINRELLGLDR